MCRIRLQCTCSASILFVFLKTWFTILILLMTWRRLSSNRIIFFIELQFELKRTSIFVYFLLFCDVVCNRFSHEARIGVWMLLMFRLNKATHNSFRRIKLVWCSCYFSRCLVSSIMHLVVQCTRIIVTHNAVCSVNTMMLHQ